MSTNFQSVRTNTAQESLFRGMEVLEETPGDAPDIIAVSTISVPIVANHTHITHTRLIGAMNAHQADIRQTYGHFRDVRAAQRRMCNKIVARGVNYKYNSVQSRGGYMLENAQAESFNVDAIIRRSPARAYVPASNKAGSPDIVVTDSVGKILNFSDKFYESASKSARAQTDPHLEGQVKIVPKDQLADALTSLERRAHREELRGRPVAAKRQRDTAIALTDRIEVDGVESVMLTKKNAHDLAKAMTVDKNGVAMVDMMKIDAVLDETGITEKVKTAVKQDAAHIEEQKGEIVKTRKTCVRAEIKGAATAAGIAALTTAAATVTIKLIENGVSLKTLHTAVVNGVQSGTEGGGVALGVYGATRTAGAALSNAAANVLTSAGVTVTANVTAGVGVGIMGMVATTAVSAYTFAKLKSQGASTREALGATGKNAAVSIGVTLSAGVTTLAFGAAAGAAVSAVAGIGMIGFSLIKAFRNRRRKSSQSGFNTGLMMPSCFT